MSAVIETARVGGFDALILTNGVVRVAILPALGGRVWALEDLARGRQWIWHREDVPLAEALPGAEYDAVWAGGWEELFPNDAPGVFEGRDLPDHGEWWTLRWSVAEQGIRSDGAAVVTLRAETSTRAAHCQKRFVLPAVGGGLTVDYRIESHEAEPFHFLFKQHLPLQLSDGCALMLPGGMVHPVDPAFGTMLRGGNPLPWPADSGVGSDLRMAPSRRSAAREFVYVEKLPAGWCGMNDATTGSAIRMQFDRSQLPYVWLFMTYGGWRDCHTVVLEPCTNMPKQLTDAVRLGRSARLAPGEVFATAVTVTVGGIEPVVV